jgi:hypothetical protein
MRRSAAQALPRLAAPALLVLALLALAPLGRPAGAADLYRAELVEVDVTASDAVTARARAIEQAQRQGLRLVLEQLTLPDPRLPDVDQLDIDRYVRSFEVAEEQVSPTRYIAKLNITYDPGAVEGLLRGSGVAYIDRPPEPVLVVPAIRRGSAWALWQDDPWRLAWNARPDRGRLLEILLPLGDGWDVASLPAEALGASYFPGLDSLAARYGAVTAYVAAAELPTGELAPGMPVRVELLGATYEATPAPLTATTGQGLDPVAMLEPVVAATVAALERSWKQDSLVRAGTPGSLAVEVPLADLFAWVQIRRDLETLPVVRRLRIDSLERARASLTIDYLGEPRDLEAALTRVGLSLVQEDDRWRLLRAGGRGVIEVPLTAPPPQL